MRIECKKVIGCRPRTSVAARAWRELSDDDLAWLASRGEQKAFQRLVERYCSAVYSMVDRRVCDAGTAERIVIEVFRTAWHELRVPPYRRGFLVLLAEAVAAALHRHDTR
ncbi:hypothetical protein GCM10022222_33280 [Amycolatopsis ultiminotia]|uniref:RNA polymerase sigma-70 region 2 domain-containing protein n=1 Tax=Amycolatopsis ultiminotia TaxID=543629 RepID=A0ABP6W8B8_9PSEU